MPAPARSWGSSGDAPGLFRSPLGITCDPAGNIYVADTNNDRIQKFTDWGSLFSNSGTNGSGPGQFIAPLAVAVDAIGNVFIADGGNHRVQKFAAATTAVRVTTWGSVRSMYR